jgi:hypothetical protein
LIEGLDVSVVQALLAPRPGYCRVELAPAGTGCGQPLDRHRIA